MLLSTQRKNAPQCVALPALRRWVGAVVGGVRRGPSEERQHLFYDARMFRLRGVRKLCGPQLAVDVDLDAGARPHHRAPRSLGLRQVDAACACAWASSRPTPARSASTAARSIATARRRIGYVIQDGGLFPHLTARQNVALPARERARAEVDARIAELAELVQLPTALLARYPRRALGRTAAAREPDARAHARSRGAAARRAVRRARSDHPRRAAAGSAAHRADARQDDGAGDARSRRRRRARRRGHPVARGTRRAARGARRRWCASPADPFVTQFIEAQRAPLARLDA